MEKQELKEISISIWERLRSAIQEGNKSKAADLLNEMQEEFDK